MHFQGNLAGLASITGSSFEMVLNLALRGIVFVCAFCNKLHHKMTLIYHIFLVNIVLQVRCRKAEDILRPTF